jgi:hypothetical protein
MIVWSAAFLLSLLDAALAEATDISMGVGYVGVILLIAILLVLTSQNLWTSFVAFPPRPRRHQTVI